MLSKRQRVHLRRLGRRLFQQRGHCPRKHGDCISLAEVSSEQKATITCNADVKTIERGLYLGMSVSIIRNDPVEPNLIIAVGDARYVIDRRIARQIMVRIVGRA